MKIIDAWAQHPTLRHTQDPVFDSLRRWTKGDIPTQQLPVAATVATMDQYDPPRNAFENTDGHAKSVEEAATKILPNQTRMKPPSPGCLMK